MTHAKAIAHLLITNFENSPCQEFYMRQGYALAYINAIIGQAERLGFEHGDIVRETLPGNRAGMGYSLPPVRPLKAQDRAAIVSELHDAGYAAELVKVRRKWRVRFL